MYVFLVPTKQRVFAYIDGFNLYYGLRDANLHTSRWLDLKAMCISLLRTGQQLHLVRYFTTRVRNNPSASQRQSVFIDALSARGGIEIDYGHFLSKKRKCQNCGSTWHRHEEKKTDVNIAVRLLGDAFDDHFDVAMIISGDSDLAPSIKSVRLRYPDKRLVVAFPPRRNSSELRRVAHANFTIPRAVIRSSHLTDPVLSPSGTSFKAPNGWLPPNPPA